MAANNTTTLEIGHGGDNTYDLGSKWSNFTSVFGTKKLYWFIPLRSTPGNGYQFATEMDLHLMGGFDDEEEP